MRETAAQREYRNAISEANALRAANAALRAQNQRLRQQCDDMAAENHHLRAQFARNGWTQLPHKGEVT